jgi:hypothetical protein
MAKFLCHALKTSTSRLKQQFSPHLGTYLNLLRVFVFLMSSGIRSLHGRAGSAKGLDDSSGKLNACQISRGNEDYPDQFVEDDVNTLIAEGSRSLYAEGDCVWSEMNYADSVTKMKEGMRKIHSQITWNCGHVDRRRLTANHTNKVDNLYELY